MGIAATLVYAIVSAVGNEAFAITPVFASIIGQVASAGVSYFGHSLFSFRVKTNHQAYLLRFLIIAAIMFALNSAVTWLIADVLKLSPRIAIATVAVLIPIVNYVCNRFWVFTPGPVPANLARASMASQATEFDAGPG